MYFDPTYVLVLLGALISMFASFRVQTSFSKYSRMNNHRGLTAEQAAYRILQDAGIYDVHIERIRGNLTDHYDPTANVIRLSESAMVHLPFAPLRFQLQISVPSFLGH